MLAGSGLVSPVRPDRLVGMGRSLARWGMSPATAVAAAAARDPHRVAVIDEDGSVTYAELDRRSNAVARGLRQLGVRERDNVALLARNSRQFLLAQAAVAKVGADLIYLNTGFSGPQVGDVVRGEKVALLIADEEFAGRIAEAAPSVPLVTGLDELAAGDDRASPRPGHTGRHVILTSGTSGRPKAAPREAPGAVTGAESLLSLLDAIPLRARETTVLAAPMFHAWGLSNLIVALVLSSTLLLRRRFDPAETMGLLAAHDATALVAVPVMLQRIVELRDAPTITPGLRIAAVSGSSIPASVAERFMDTYGDVVYSLYGSTEVAFICVAGPRELREAPGTAGRPLHQVSLRIVDDAGREVPPGTPGRIFAGNGLTFDGYSGGLDGERLGALVATGDLGLLDSAGRLQLVGRADDMIVSGGENVHPAEVEECLQAHPAVADVAVIGADDERFGQALVAHVVRRPTPESEAVSAAELRTHVRQQLAAYKVPRDVVFHEALPRNETGKVLKRMLAEPT